MTTKKGFPPEAWENEPEWDKLGKLPPETEYHDAHNLKLKPEEAFPNDPTMKKGYAEWLKSKA